jgi:hypothetical protein
MERTTVRMPWILLRLRLYTQLVFFWIDPLILT